MFYFSHILQEYTIYSEVQILFRQSTSHSLDLLSAPWHQVVLQGLVGQDPRVVQDYLLALWDLALQDHPELGQETAAAIMT